MLYIENITLFSCTIVVNLLPPWVVRVVLLYVWGKYEKNINDFRICDDCVQCGGI